jgi:hypothetical protein
MLYLRNSSEIKQQLTQLFSEEGEKWAVVGFVGYNAIDHLPAHVKNLSIVCWPKAGGTNPDGVRRLIDNGISVYFCDNLHQKIYWRKGAGLIIGSANLSSNGLGDKGLHEFGVYCDDEKFDISHVLAALNYVPVTSAAMAKLDVEHRAQAQQKSENGENCGNKGDLNPPAFLDSIKIKFPKQWKLITWSEIRDNDDQIKVKADLEKHFGSTKSVNDNDIDPKDSNVFAKGDFILQVKTNEKGLIVRSDQIKWLYVDHIIWKRGLRAVVQVSKWEHRIPSPFKLDSTFQKHFKELFNAYTDKGRQEEIYDANYVVKSSFIDVISNS